MLFNEGGPPGRALARNKLRSALTMLGVFIGVAALIAMVAVGQGANEAVEKQLGLKLEPRKDSVEMLVVDRVEKPSAN